MEAQKYPILKCQIGIPKIGLYCTLHGLMYPYMSDTLSCPLELFFLKGLYTLSYLSISNMSTLRLCKRMTHGLHFYQLIFDI